MGVTFEEALVTAQAKYPHPINHYEEYERYFVFGHDNGEERVGGECAPIVIRKSDGAALNYLTMFFRVFDDEEDVGEVLSEGAL